MEFKNELKNYFDAFDNLITTKNRIFTIVRDGKVNADSQDTIPQSELPKLVSHLYYLWSLLNIKEEELTVNENAQISDQYKQEQIVKNEIVDKSYPDPSEIIAIFIFLGYGSKNHKDRFKNYFIQIDLSKNKLLILMIVSTVYALFGFQVFFFKCFVDQEEIIKYQVLFKELNVENCIHDLTLNQICDKFLNENGNLREAVKSLILNENLDFSKQTHRPNILITEEVIIV